MTNSLENFEDNIRDMSLTERLKIAADIRSKQEALKYYLDLDFYPYFEIVSNGGHQWDRFEVENDCVRFFNEENTACNCHPEYETVEYVIFFEDFELTPENYKKKLEEQKKNDRQLKAMMEAEAKRVAEEKAKADKLERDKKTYEALKKQFETGNP